MLHPLKGTINQSYVIIFIIHKLLSLRTGEDPSFTLCNADPWDLLMELSQNFSYWFMTFIKHFVRCNFMWPFSFLQTMGTAKGIVRCS